MILRPVRAALAAVAFAVCAVAAEGAGPPPPALYTAAQAKAGDSVYGAKCALCHGAQLEGGAGPPLSGPNMTTLGVKTHLTVGDLFGYVTSNMPMNAPASLTHDQYVVVLAFILKRNGFPSGAKPLTYATAMSSTVMVRSYK